MKLNYTRDQMCFNLCILLHRDKETSAYEQVVRKMALALRSLELEGSFKRIASTKYGYAVLHGTAARVCEINSVLGSRPRTRTARHAISTVSNMYEVKKIIKELVGNPELQLDMVTNAEPSLTN
ncbi:hypothetical protein BJ742DRAFT_871041 [Cladochytrium replicatum]|nr:hypothetical protein BJ742DRAFT_871041 [Cladochytrium replicatum]